MVSLIGHLGHDDASCVTGEGIIEWKEALDRQGVGGRTIREVYLAAAKVVFGWAVENRKLVANPAIGVTLTIRLPGGPKSRCSSGLLPCCGWIGPTNTFLRCCWPFPIGNWKPRLPRPRRLALTLGRLKPILGPANVACDGI